MSRGERLVQRISGSTGDPAVCSSTIRSTAATASGCAMLALSRPPFFSDAALGWIVRQFLNVLSTLKNGGLVAAKQFGDILRAAMPEFFGFHRGVPSPIFLGQGLV